MKRTAPLYVAPRLRRTISYFFDGQLHYARQATDESVMAAVTRSIDKLTGEHPQLWFYEDRDGHEVYIAKWFDRRTKSFVEAEVVVE